MSGVSLAVAPRSEAADQSNISGMTSQQKSGHHRPQQDQTAAGVLGTTIGLFFPLAYVLGGFARGDDHAVRSATPHLFLLSFQILTENLISGFSLFSPPVRALVPLLYTVRRLFVILDWLQDVWLNKTLPEDAQFKDVSWYWFGRGLAAANLVYFSINLLAFLIPRFLPRAFERYFRERDEIHAKAAEDKYARAASKQSKSADDKKAD